MTVRVLSAVENQDSAIVHASCVALDGRGLLITGDAGSGKSGLALQLMALGSLLVADDRVELKMSGNKATAQSPENIRGVIEARGLGLLRADTVGSVALAYVVDLNRTETARLPDPVDVKLLRQTVPLLHAADIPHFAASLIQLLKAGRTGPEWPNQ